MSLTLISRIVIVYFGIVTICNAYLLEFARLFPDIRFKQIIRYQAGSNIVHPITPENIAKANGYPFEYHFVTTSDGHILELHRIPGSSSSSKLPVLIIHGNFQSSVDWLINSPANSSLGFLLSNNGYDVWLGNHRGNQFSTRHLTHSMKTNAFWNHSWHEMGLYDVPAMIDYILMVTRKPQLHYLSFSMGTTAFFAGMALQPEYSEKVATGIAMGPSVFQDHFFNGLLKLFPISSPLGNFVLQLLGSFPILPHSVASFLHLFLPLFCNPNFDLLKICHNFVHLFFGLDGDAISERQLPLITSVSPSPTGFKTFMHFIQHQTSKVPIFRQFDYGALTNLAIYQSLEPPAYNLTQVSCPVALFVGYNDFLAHRQDAKILRSRLPNVISFYKVPYRKFTHLDFTYGRHVAEIAYNEILKLLER